MNKKTFEQNLCVIKKSTDEQFNRFDFLCSNCLKEFGRNVTCEECGSNDNVACDWRRSDHRRCSKCQKIQYPLMSWFYKEYNGCDFLDEWSYIYYKIKKEKGLEVYKKARDKLIKRIKKFDEQTEIKDETNKKKLMENIKKW